MTTLHESTTTRTFETSLGRVHARVLGEGPTAVLWHGMFVDGRSWDGVATRLAAHRRLVVLDGPGYGSSDELTRLSSIEECAEVAAQIVDQLGTGPVDWLGAAWGGHVGMTAASLYPGLFRSLVAVSSPVEPVEPALRIKLIVAGAMLARVGPIAHLRHAVHEAQLTKEHRRDPRMVEVLDAAITAISPVGLARTMTSFIFNRTDATHRLPRITAPTVFVTGDDRAEWSPETMAAAARLVPNARTAVVAGARTLVPVEKPAELARIVTEFWAEGDAR